MDTTTRRLGRLSGFSGITLAAIVEYAVTIAWRPMPDRSRYQGAWLQRTARRIAQLLHLRVEVHGRWQAAPVVACNHLSYLDVITLTWAAATPVRFVAKEEVRKWPWFGWLARCGGTIFARRARHRSLRLTNEESRQAGAEPVTVAIFPEATSTDGERVQPFRSALLEVPATEAWAVQPAWLGYEVAGGDAAREVCWWGEMTLLPHLWKLLGHEEIVATVRFGRLIRHWDRKVLATELHHSVCELAELPLSTVPRVPQFAKLQLLEIKP
jgi:1-acyl-sn-glycerol-3-phosphate acyltransferase